MLYGYNIDLHNGARSSLVVMKFRLHLENILSWKEGNRHKKISGSESRTFAMAQVDIIIEAIFVNAFSGYKDFDVCLLVA